MVEKLQFLYLLNFVTIVLMFCLMYWCNAKCDNDYWHSSNSVFVAMALAFVFPFAFFVYFIVLCVYAFVALKTAGGEWFDKVPGRKN